MIATAAAGHGSGGRLVRLTTTVPVTLQVSLAHMYASVSTKFCMSTQLLLRLWRRCKGSCRTYVVDGKVVFVVSVPGEQPLPAVKVFSNIVMYVPERALQASL